MQAAVYLEDKDRGEHRRVRNETLSEAIRKDYWREIDWLSAHPLTDGPGPGFRPEYTMPPLMPGNLGAMAEQQRKAFGMAGGASRAPQPPISAQAPESWTCPKCGKADNTGHFCPNCGAEGNTGRFCPECGSAGPEKG